MTLTLKDKDITMHFDKDGVCNITLIPSFKVFHYKDISVPRLPYLFLKICKNPANWFWNIALIFTWNMTHTLAFFGWSFEKNNAQWEIHTKYLKFKLTFLNELFNMSLNIPYWIEGYKQAKIRMKADKK